MSAIPYTIPALFVHVYNGFNASGRHCSANIVYSWVHSKGSFKKNALLGRVPSRFFTILAEIITK